MPIINTKVSKMGEENLRHSLIALAVSSLLLFSGCGGGDSAKEEPTINHTPQITSSATTTVAENQTSAIDIDATDPDGDNLLYSISGGDYRSFDINSSTGLVTFKVAPDYEIKTTYSFTATVSDGNLSVIQAITLKVLNIAEELPQLQNLAEVLNTFTYSGDVNWSESSDEFYTGDSSWSNQDTNDSQSSCMVQTTDETSAKQLSFYTFFLLTMAGNFGLIISQDIFSFYLFFTLMSLASYGLIVFNRDKESFYAGLVYIILVVIGEVILFVTFLLLAQTSEQLHLKLYEPDI